MRITSYADLLTCNCYCINRYRCPIMEMSEWEMMEMVEMVEMVEMAEARGPYASEVSPRSTCDLFQILVSQLNGIEALLKVCLL
jgi:hypothetical protein